MLERLDQILTVHTTGKLTLINLTRPRQADSGRPGTSLVADTTHHRPVAFGSPGVSQGLQKGQPELIEKDDFYAESPRFFLS